MILIIGIDLSIMQYELLDDLPQNNCLRCNFLIDLRYILAVRTAPKFNRNDVKTSITIERLVMRKPSINKIILKQIVFFE